MRCMSVASAEEALQLFSASARIIGDLTRALNYTGEWSIHIVVREFTDIPLEGELRGIVYKRKLHALSQYYTSCYFPNLVKHKDEVAKHVLEFHEQVKDKIEADSYIVDFAVIDEKTIKIVELNPYGEAAGSALFNWNTDKNIFEHGPFEFRIEESADESKIKTMLTIWRGLIDAALGQDSKEIGNNNNRDNEEGDGHNNNKGHHSHGDNKKRDCSVM